MNIEIPEQTLPPSLQFGSTGMSLIHPKDMDPEILKTFLKPPKNVNFQVPLRRFRGPQQTLEQFIQDNLQKLYQDEQYEVFDLYKDIKEALKDNVQTRDPLAIGRLSQYQNMSLAIALKEFMPKYNGKVLLKTTAEGGAINYIHVNPDTINHLMNLLEDDENTVRDSIQGFGFATLRNMNVEVLFEDHSKNSKQGKKKSGEFFPYYNNSNFDLSEYGIYTKDQIKNDACLITAIENSKVLSENE